MTAYNSDPALKELEALARAVAGGKWRATSQGVGIMTPPTRGWIAAILCEEPLSSFIAAVNPEAVLQLIARVRELEAEVQRLREALASIVTWTRKYGADLCASAPWHDTYGDGQRAAKAHVARLIPTAAPAPSAPPAPEPRTLKEPLNVGGNLKPADEEPSEP